jgi:hypothetical protein
MSHKTLKHLMMPSPPGSSFVVVHSSFAFVFLKRGFNGPSQSADADQFLARAMRGSIAQIEFLFRLRSKAATADKPLAKAGQASTDGGNAQYRKLCNQRTLATLVDQMTMPGGSRQIPGQHPQLFGRGRTPADAAMQAGWAHTAGTRFFYPRSAQPDPRVPRYLGHVPFAQGRDGIRKTGIFPVTFVVGDPGEGNDRALIRFLQHIQRQLTLGLKLNALRQAASFPQFAMIRREPFLRQVPTFIQKATAAATSLGQKNALLAVRDFSQVTTILRGHPNRVFPLLGKAATVYDRHAVAFSQPSSHQSLQVHDERSCIPLTFTHEPLQVADRIRNGA